MSSPSTAASSFLTLIDAEPEETRLKLFREIMAEDPLALFAELRENRPILVLRECVIVARYDEIIEMLNMPDIFTAALYIPKMANNYLMMHDGDALHMREKSIMHSLLNRDDLPKVRAMVAKIASGILKEHHGHMEAVYQYCRMVPATIVRDYFGLIGAELSDLIEWSYWAQADTFYNQPFDILTPKERLHIETRHAETGEKLAAYLKALILTKVVATKFEFLTGPLRRLWRRIRNKEGKLDDDIVSRMMRTKYPPEVGFDVQRQGVNAGGLLIGTIETTAQTAAQAVQYLLKRPDVLDRARNAAQLPDGTQIDAIVWEALRFVPIAPYMFRQTSAEYTLGKGTDFATTIPPSTNVLALTQSAMFDERAYDHPGEFIPGRPLQNNFTFGYGVHTCLGKYIGMVMVPEMVRQMLLLPGLHAKSDIVYDGHLPKAWPVAWTA